MTIPFSNKKESEMFTESLNDFIFKANRKKMSAYMSTENMYTLHHGSSFGFTDNNESELTEHTVNIEFEYSNIRLYKIEQFYEFISDFIEQINSEMAKNMFKTLSDTCEKTGNIVDVKQKTITNAEAFLEMIQKVEFSVDKNGKVLVPTVYLHPSQSQKFMDELKAQGKEYTNKVEEIQKEKSE